MLLSCRVAVLFVIGWFLDICCVLCVVCVVCCVRSQTALGFAVMISGNAVIALVCFGPTEDVKLASVFGELLILGGIDGEDDPDDGALPPPPEISDAPRFRPVTPPRG